MNAPRARNMRQELPLDVRLMDFTSRALLWLVALGALVVAGNRVLEGPWWAIRSVRMAAPLQHVSAAGLRSEALTHLQGNWFTVSLGSAQQAFEQVPWVRKAVVQRVWPLSLLVTLQEQQPLALWIDAGSGTPSLVNTDGQAFEANLGEVQDMNLPRFSGPAGSQARVSAMYAQLSRAFASRHWRIRILELGAQGDWRVSLDPGPDINLGSDADPQAFAQRVQRFLDLQQSVAERYGRAIVSADLRYANGFALRLQGTDAAPGPGAATPNTAKTRRSR